MRNGALVTAALVLTVLTIGAHAQDKGQPGTYRVGQTINAHTLIVCNAKDYTLAVAEAFKTSDEAGDKKLKELEATKNVVGEAVCGRLDGKNMLKIMELPILQDSVGEGADREKMTVIKMETITNARSVWALIFGSYDFVDRGRQAGGDPVKEVAALQTKGGSNEWDDEVKEIMLSAYDADRSGSLDKQSEVQAIPCEVWRTLHRQITGGDKASGLAWTYGFKPGDYEYVGDAFGIDAKLRSAAFQRIKGCGIDTGAETANRRRR